MDDRELDKMIKNALSTDFKPDLSLDEAILKKARERKMKKSNLMKKYLIVAIVAMFVIAGSVVAFAVWQYLTPHEVALASGDEKLAEAFKAPNSILVESTKIEAGYEVTLLGVVSGENLAESEFYTNGELASDRTYAVVAISNEDGTPMPDTSDEAYGQKQFFVSPLIQGLNPVVYNIITMNGGYLEMVKDGIMYRIIECDNIEPFADRNLYLCVSDTTFYHRNAYAYDEASGLITANESYEGLNLLFDLPLDKAKADETAAMKYLESLNSEPEVNSGESEAASNQMIPFDVLENITVEEVLKYWTFVAEEVVTVNEDGMIEYFRSTDQGSMGGSVMLEAIFNDGETGYSQRMSLGGNNQENHAVLFHRDDAGQITVFFYRQEFTQN